MTDFNRPITKAVIAAAGMGTRFLPATKNQPKEMLPIIDKPIIHYLVDEAVNAGIKDIILVTRVGNHIMEDYFDNRSELEYALESSGKLDRLKIIQDIPKMANFIYVRQKNHMPYGNATPLLAVKHLIDDDESFVYMFGDDLTISHTQDNVLAQLIQGYKEEKPAGLLAVQEVPDEEVDRYATVKYKEGGGSPLEIEYGLEKVPLGENPSNMAQFGRFVFSYDVIKAIDAANDTGKDGELWVIDILNKLARNGEKIIAKPIEGEWVTTGDPIRYLKTTLKFAMMRDDLRLPLIEAMKEIVEKEE